MDEKDKITTVIKLNMKEQLFVKHYTCIGPDTFQNGTKSAIASKYPEASAHNRASKLLRDVRIRGAIQALWAQNLDNAGITCEFILNGMLHNHVKLLEAEDYGKAQVCLQDLARTRAMFSEKLIITSRVSAIPERRREDMTEAEQKNYDREQRAILASASAYKKELSPGQGSVSSFINAVPIETSNNADSVASDEIDTPDEIVFEEVERIPESEVGKIPRRPTHSL